MGVQVFHSGQKSAFQGSFPPVLGTLLLITLIQWVNIQKI